MTSQHQMLTRGFLGGAILLIVVFGTVTLTQGIESNSPMSRAAKRLLESRYFELMGVDWESEWSLQALEKAPWSGANKTSEDDLNPHKTTLVINFWATWCEPCRAELPAMFQLARQMEKTNVKWVFVSYDESWADPQALLQRVRGSLPSNIVMLRDPAANPNGQQDNSTLMSKLGTQKLPETYFVKDGRILSKIIGAINWKQPDIKDYVLGLASK